MAATFILLAYLALFFLLTLRAARAAGRRVWLFGTATGRDRLAAVGFRAAFALALAAPFVPAMAGLPVTGSLIALAGAGLALAAQIAMGRSWRVGVRAGETGALVASGLFRLSRNPTFLGQALLLAGCLAALPSLPGLAGLALFLWSARTQIRSEEAALLQSNGAAYSAYMARVPRWLVGRG